MYFHLSVNSLGVVSLWDTEVQARRASRPTGDESYVRMELTSEQEAQIKQATRYAGMPRKGVTK